MTEWTSFGEKTRKTARARILVPNAGRRELLNFRRREGKGNTLLLAFEDIRLDRRTSLYYEIYLNLPASAKDTVYTSPYYVGNLSFFGISSSPDEKRIESTRVFPIASVYERLSSLKQWTDSSLNLTLVPRGPTEESNPARLAKNETQVTIGRVVLRIQ